MKKYIISLLLSFLFGASYAQSSNLSPVDNYVILTKKIQQLKPILLASGQLRSEFAHETGAIKIIICGKEVDQLTDVSIMSAFLEEASRLDVSLIACGFSLNKFKVDRQDVLPGINIVENGIFHNLKLQHQGYLNLSL